MQRRFQQVDVFSSTAYKGNPLGVVLDAPGLSSQEMINYSRWSNLSEVTFVLPSENPDADYRFRIFAREREYPFAGHPALGTARAWLAEGGVPKNSGLILAECEAGVVPIKIQGDVLSFASPPTIRSGTIEASELAEVLHILGVEQSQVLDSQWVDNGPGWMAILLDDHDLLLGLDPKIPIRPGRWKIGVIAPLAHAQDEEKFEVRALTIENGTLREDPVTGSLNGAAAQWLINTQKVHPPLINRQGSVIGYEGRVYLDVSDEHLWVGGHTQVLIRGTIEL
ncbi:PhzF family phenazine biosynthesis protein [Glutamicibacter sp. AOP5-A2-18]|uniref:PhzF family phenazine biosynthesis protein n=1 Tax=Glutamicibacter sp. AOP5-A2-18 TaxID=3457656 RepID=UPI0040347A0E